MKTKIKKIIALIVLIFLIAVIGNSFAEKSAQDPGLNSNPIPAQELMQRQPQKPSQEFQINPNSYLEGRFTARIKNYEEPKIIKSKPFPESQIEVVDLKYGSGPDYLVGEPEKLTPFILRLQNCLDSRLSDSKIIVKVIEANSTVRIGDNFKQTYQDNLESFLSNLSTKVRVYSANNRNSEKFPSDSTGADYLALAQIYNLNYVRLKIYDLNSYEIIFSSIVDKDVPANADFSVVTINSLSHKSLIRINGVEYGRTPLAVVLYPGVYKVESINSHNRIETETLRIDGDPSKNKFYLGFK